MSEYDSLWIEEEVRSFGIDVPRWIEQDITCSDVAAIMQGGCESGAYMPAVTYHLAIETMKEYSDQIIDVLDENVGEYPDVNKIGWYGLACWMVSFAVECWCSSIEEELQHKLADRHMEEEEEESEEELCETCHGKRLLPDLTGRREYVSCPDCSQEEE